MGLPGNLTTITVTGKYTNPDGSAANGSVSFTPTTAVVDGSNNVIIPAAPISTSLANGTFSTVLACTDSSGLKPTIWAWNVLVTVPGVDGPQSSFTVYLPSTLGATVDISALNPIPGVSPGPISLLNSNNTWTGTNTFLGTYPTTVVLPGGYLPLPTGTAIVGSVPTVATVNPLSLVWGAGGGGGGGGGTATALATTTSGVIVSTAVAPGAGQVLTAQSGTNATWATPAGTVSYALTAGTAAYALTSGTAFYSLTSGTAAYALTSGTAAYSLSSGTAFYATSAGTAFYSLTSGTAAYSLASGTAFYSNSAGTVYAISALTTLGDMLYENSTPAPARLAGNTTAVRNFLTQTGTGAVSAAPAWGTITAADLPTASTSVQGAVILDGTAADIQPSPATQAAGATGKAADAGHVHGQPPVLAPTGLTGATAASRYAGATVTGPPTSGTFSVGDWIQAQDGPIWLCVTAGTPGNWKQAALQAFQFQPETYGAKGNGQLISDGAITATLNVLTTVGVVNASTAPTVNNSGAGGTILAGTYQVKYTYVTPFGETTASSSTSTTTTGSLSTITVTAPAIVPGGAIGYHVYITAANGSTFFRQTPAAFPYPFQNNFVLLAPPSTSTPQPPVSNTTASAPFTAGDVGKAIRVIGAGAAGADLVTTISGFTSSSSVNLTANAGTTVSGSGVAWGTDDTAAVQSAINAAAAYAALNSNATAEVLCRAVIYMLNTAPVVGGTFGGNCVLQLPNPADGGPKLKIAIRSMSQDASTLPVYQQMWPEVSGACFMYIGPVGTNDATYGPAHVFGTPTNPNVYVNESGTTPGTVNIKIVMDSIRVVVPYKGGIGGIDLFSAAESDNRSCSAQALAIVPAGGSWAQMATTGPSTNQWGWGLREPGAGNNAMSYTEQFTCEGLCYGYGPSEHLVAVDIFCAYCVTGIETYAGNGITMVHNGHIVSAGVELCTNAVGAFDGGVKMDIDNLRVETIGKVIFDPSNRLQGTIGLRAQNTTGTYNNNFFNGGASVKLINLMTSPGAIAAPQAPPSTGGTWSNFYYRDASITVNVSGGIMSALAIGTVDQYIPSNCVIWNFLLPSGQSYTPTYTGSIVHNVTLM